MTAIAVAVTITVGCSGDDQTGIVLTVEVEQALDVHQVLVNARTNGGATMLFSRASPEAPSGPVTRQVFAIVDDGDLSGTPVDFEVLGTTGDGTHVATAFASASFAKGRVVRVTARLGGGEDRCGDSACEGGEDCSSCPEDCGPCGDECGDAFCDPELGECQTCPDDCDGRPECSGDCGDDICDANRGECKSCPRDCDGSSVCEECGDGVCDVGRNECDDCRQDCDDEPACPCDHGVCEEGAPLPAFCDGDTCVAAVCDMFPQCCTTAWDGECRRAAAMLCSLPGCACGDGMCTPPLGEGCDECDLDCGKCVDVDAGTGTKPDASLENCGNSMCDFDEGEDCVNCPGDCTMPCPPEMGLCNFCPGPGEVAFCTTCGAACGDGTCLESAGENCSSCPDDCGGCPAGCGDGICDLEETCDTCTLDCGPCDECGDATCGPGETCWNCPNDCADDSCGIGMCSNCPSPIAAPVCGPCTTCGDDTCVASAGETCGTCEADCGACGCGGDVCAVGPPRAPSCGACEAAICALDPACCLFGWDARCVSFAEGLCGGC